MSPDLLTTTERRVDTGHGDAPADRPSERRPRILVVDDDATLLRSLRRVLAPHYEVQCESNPYRALVALEDDGPFAAVVSDLTMPGLDGVALLETAYAHAPETARILLTGTATLPASIEAVNKAHVTNLLVKPVAAEDLLRTLRDAVLANAELTADFDAGAEVLDGSADTLLAMLGHASPAACSLTRRSSALVEAYLADHPRADGWEVTTAARLAYLTSAVLGADPMCRAALEDTPGDGDLLAGCVTGFTVETVARIPRLATVETILRHHRVPRTAGADLTDVPFGARLLCLTTRLAELESTIGTPTASTALRAEVHPALRDLLEDVLAAAAGTAAAGAAAIDLTAHRR